MGRFNKPVVAIDLETTGLDTSSDRVVEIGIIRMQPDGTRQTFKSFVNPEIPIPQETTDIHGVTDEIAGKAPTFKEIADDVAFILDGAVLTGYNISRFDGLMLESEMLRAGIDFDLAAFDIVDSFWLFKIMELRTLGYAYEFYCGKPMDDAHSALPDANASLEVLIAQSKRYEELFEVGIGELESVIDPERKQRVDGDGKLIRDDDGRVRINFGKYEGRLLAKVASNSRGHAYLEWMLGAEFSDKVKSIIRAVVQK